MNIAIIGAGAMGFRLWMVLRKSGFYQWSSCAGREKRGIWMPYNKTFYHLVKIIEQTYDKQVF